MTQRVAASALGTSDTALTSSTVRYAQSGLNRYKTVTTEGGSAEVLEYDAEGRLAADVHRRYEWDADGRLHEVR